MTRRRVGRKVATTGGDPLTAREEGDNVPDIFDPSKMTPKRQIGGGAKMECLDLKAIKGEFLLGGMRVNWALRGSRQCGRGWILR